jgi:hypothetical protein
VFELKSVNLKSCARSDGLARQRKQHSKTNGAIRRGVNSNTFMARPPEAVFGAFFLGLVFDRLLRWIFNNSEQLSDHRDRIDRAVPAIYRIQAERKTHAYLKQSVAFKQPHVLAVTGPFFYPGDWGLAGHQGSNECPNVYSCSNRVSSKNDTFPEHFSTNSSKIFKHPLARIGCFGAEMSVESSFLEE